MRVCIWPSFRGEDQGDGGVRRVIEAQHKYLPVHGVDVVETAEEADVIACHITAPQTLLNTNKPLIAQIHGAYWSEYDWWEWALRANRDVMELIRRSDFVTAPSEWVAQTIRRHTSRQVEAVYHGVDTELWKPGKSNGYVLWNKTRQDPVCDPDPMQRVAELLPETPFISTLGSETKNVHVVGKHSYEESKRYVQEAGIYLATARETLGIGTLEAMACGVPVVGFDWGGNSEIITNKVHGWLARPGDIAGLMEGIEYCLENRSELGYNARQRSKDFSWDRAAARYAEIYERAGQTGRRNFPGVSVQPKVSVIVTAYKLEGYIDDCLASVAASKFEDFECIVVDDASPDKCGEIADAWAGRDPRFRVIHNTENAYLAGARNVGIQAAKGSYILPLDADDRLDPNAIKTLSKALDEDRGIHIAYGNVRFVEADGREWHSGWPIEYNFDFHVYGARNLLPYCSMFRKEVWSNTGGYRTRLKTGEDADFWIRAASYGFRPRMVTTADTLIYTNREGSMSRTVEKISWEDWYPWIRNHELTPAGAATNTQLPVPSLDPQVINVVIPCGPGHEKHLMTAVDSVDAQTFRNFICTVVNDTGKEFDFPIPSWVSVLGPFHKNLGPAKARNIAIDSSKAPFFVPLDADDYLQPGALQTMFNVWLQEKKIVYCDFYEDPFEEGTFRHFTFEEFDPSILLRHCLHSIVSLVQKKIWEDVGGYDEELPGWEDWAFQLSCAEKCYCSVRVPVPLFTYRKWTGMRREENYANKEEYKIPIKKRFGKYWEGEKLMAGCNSCGSNRGPAAMQQPMSVARQLAVDDATKIYNPNGGTAGITYRGPVSGRQYRFNGTDWNWVLNSDVPSFQSRGFVVYDDPGAGNDSPALMTAGSKIEG